MPPKAKDAKPAKILLGRPGNNVKMGIVGLPNVGKSTFFNVLTRLNVPAENFPFCTIEPTEARVPVPDERFDWLVSHYKPKSAVSAVLTVTDIAGLVKGAYKGAGLGNSFLSNIQAVDGIFHVCRGFSGEDVTHVEGSVDPVRDLEIITRELLLKDIFIVRSFLAKSKKSLERGIGSKELREEVNVMEKVYDFMLGADAEEGAAAGGGGAAGAGGGGGGGGGAPAARTSAAYEVEDWEPPEKIGKEVRMGFWTASEVEVLNKFQLLTAKPVVYLINLSEKQYTTRKCKWLVPVKEWIDARGAGEKLIPFSAEFEKKIVEFGEDKAAAETFTKESGAESMYARIVLAGYKALSLVHFFTAGEDEVKAWTIRKGCTAPKAAGTIHTDFEKGFVCAEVHHYNDIKELLTEAEVRKAGKMRTEGKAYEVQDGDVMFFKFTAPSKGK